MGFGKVLERLYVLSIIFPDSPIKTVAVRVFSVIVGSIIVLLSLGLIINDFNYVNPNGLIFNDNRGLSVIGLSYSTVDEHGYDPNDLLDNHDGWPITFELINNSNFKLENISLSIQNYECESKPYNFTGLTQPSDCVEIPNESENIYGQNHIIMDPHTRQTFRYKSYVNFKNYSSGKYPYLFWRFRVVRADKFDESPKSTEGYDVNEYMR